jgi:arabinose-5-phosphate isomerase
MALSAINQLSNYLRGSLTRLADTLRDIELDEHALKGAIDLMLGTSIPIVCSGVGKSGFIAAKLVATLNSLSVRAVYLNPTDALHGDLGLVDDGSVVILISNSGSTAELCNLVPFLIARDCQMIAIVSNSSNLLAQSASYVIDYGEIKEIDEHELAPTTSTVVQLAVADILAVTVSRMRGLVPSQFHRNHPAGALGKRLMRVDDLMRKGERIPTVRSDCPLSEVLRVMGEKQIGAACVVDERAQFLGLITDGDIRRGLQQHIDFYAAVAAELMQFKPRTARLGDTIAKLMQRDDYLGRHFVIPVLNELEHLEGVIVSIDLI